MGCLLRLGGGRIGRSGVVCLAVLAAWGVVCANNIYEFPEAELVSNAMVIRWGSPSWRTIGDIPGQGAAWTVYLARRTGIGDAWPPSPNLGLGWDPVLGHYSSLADYDGIRLTIKYVSGPADSDIDLAIYMNTGLTGGSGYPSWEWRNDTWWSGYVEEVALGETVTLDFDFDHARAYNITDNPYPHTGWDDPNTYNGMWYALNDRDRHEIGIPGIVIDDYDGDVFGSTIVLHVGLETPPPVPEPMTMMGLLAGVGVLGGYIRKRR